MLVRTLYILKISPLNLGVFIKHTQIKKEKYEKGENFVRFHFTQEWTEHNPNIIYIKMIFDNIVRNREQKTE